MKALIFEGNTKAYCENMIKRGDTSYSQKFKNTIHTIDSSIVCDVAYPADSNYILHCVDDLQKYDLIFWTGSTLNAYADTVEVLNQIEQAKIVFDSAVPFYGSCWGLQIAVMASGGHVGACQNGLEIGVAQNIFVTEAGKTHPFMQGRTQGPFGAYCVHNAETLILPPEGTTVLASNTHTDIQAVEIRHSKGVFWGVQYHPEMGESDICKVFERNHQKYVSSGVIDTDTNYREYIQGMAIGLEHSLVDDNRIIELRNFILHHTA